MIALYELGLILLGGMLGSAHCIGMCGAFAVAIGATSPHAWANLNRQLVYSAGRVFTYSFGGAVAGFTGWRLGQQMGTLVNVQAMLAIVAGVLLVVQGLLSAGVLPRPQITASSSGCLTSGSLGPALRARGLSRAFLAGVLTGFLPCGLVYAYLALATSTTDILGGMLHMAAFGLGTLPVMVAVGCTGSLVSLTARQRLFRLAAWCVVLTGLVSLARGGYALASVGESPNAACPLCAQAAEADAAAGAAPALPH